METTKGRMVGRFIFSNPAKIRQLPYKFSATGGNQEHKSPCNK
jgi:hypothetical protein